MTNPTAADVAADVDVPTGNPTTCFVCGPCAEARLKVFAVLYYRVTDYLCKACFDLRDSPEGCEHCEGESTSWDEPAPFDGCLVCQAAAGPGYVSLAAGLGLSTSDVAAMAEPHMRLCDLLGLPHDHPKLY